MPAFDFLQGLQTCHAGHVLVKEDDVEHTVDNIQCILAVAGGDDLIAFVFQIDDIGLQQVYLVVNPEYLSHNASIC